MGTPGTHVLSAATAFPGDPVDNAALASASGGGRVMEQWVNAFVGTRTRHFSMDIVTGEQHHTLDELGAAAGQRALDAAGLTPDDVDVIVLSSTTPDRFLPSTVNLVADRMGIDGVPTYQILSGCSGVIQALDVAQQMLETGRHRRALVIGGDISAKHLDFTRDFASLPPAQRINYVLFGDGAGAAVLGARPTEGSALLRRVSVRLVGRGRAPGQTVDWFGTTDREDDRPLLIEDYKAIQESVPAMAAETLDELLGELGWRREDLDYILPPQLSGRMTADIMKRLDLPGAQEITAVHATGNIANAMPFIQMADVLPRMSSGQRAVCVSVESSKWIKSGYALENTR